MNGKLLIVGAGSYALVVAEIAANMGCFENIAFVDDVVKTMKNGIPVVGTTQDLKRLAGEYNYVIVAIGNPEVRLSLLDRIKKETTFQIPTLVSPRSYVSPSAKVMSGCVIEPMAVIHSGCVLEEGCLVSAGAVVNHESTCCRGVHVDCNGTVEAYTIVPAKTKIFCGEVYGNV